MDFTRQPIIETIITPREGCKIVVRSSKSSGQEEYFVDALEIVSFGNALFYRSIERPKAFLVPVSDYEVFEVREARIMLKNVGVEKTIKIGGGREAAPKLPKEPPQEKMETVPASDQVDQGETTQENGDTRLEKRKDRRRHSRRRRGKEEETPQAEPAQQEEKKENDNQSVAPESTETKEKGISPLLPPPPLLISETISRYKNNAMFKGAFYTKEEAAELGESIVHSNENSKTHPEDVLEALAMQNVSLEPSSYSTLGPIEIEQQESSIENEIEASNHMNGEKEESASGEIEPLDAPFFPFEPKE